MNYYTTTGAYVNLGIDDVITHETIHQARTFHEFGKFGKFEVHTIHPLDRHEWGARFTLYILDHNGEFMHSFDCCIDGEKGGWICEDSEFSDTTMIYAEIVEQAACDFNEVGKQAGIYKVLDFECDCDADGSQYAWIISSV